jgi:hypothetical protein
MAVDVETLATLKFICKKSYETILNKGLWAQSELTLSSNRINSWAFKKVSAKTLGTEGNCYEVVNLRTGETQAIKVITFKVWSFIPLVNAINRNSGLRVKG